MTHYPMQISLQIGFSERGNRAEFLSGDADQKKLAMGPGYNKEITRLNDLIRILGDDIKNRKALQIQPNLKTAQKNLAQAEEILRKNPKP